MKLSLLFVLCISLNIFPQQFSNWKNYTDMKHVNSASAMDNILWAATNGGAFLYNVSDGFYKTFNKTDGLSGVYLTAVAIDGNNKIWLGSNNGIIDVLNTANNNIKNILDIFINPGIISKKINQLTVSGDTIIVSTDFGISLIDANNYFFIDTFSKFGDMSSNIPVKSSLKANLLFVCTDQGIAVQKPGATNLSAPESWNVYKTTEGLPSNITRKVISYNDSVIVATRNGLAAYNGSAWNPFIPQLNNFDINDLLVAGDSLFILSDSSQVHVFVNNVLHQLYSSSSKNLTGLVHLNSMSILAASLNGIIVPEDDLKILPNGPNANQFPSITVDGNSTFWSASGTDVTGVGCYKYDNGTWENFNRLNTPELSSNAYRVVFSSSNNTIFLGSWGEGLTTFRNGVIKNHKENLGLEGIPQNINFIVITGIAEDSRNNIWILSYGSNNRKVLSRTSNQEEWTSYTIPAIGNTYIDENFNLAIDQYDTKWFACQRGKPGLFYFNERNTSNTADDVSGFINESSLPALSHNFVSSLAIDRRGDLWVGTSLGVNIISNTASVLSANPQLRISSVFALRQQTITAIAVDPLNQKWIGTNQGLILVNPDGTRLIATLDSKNSALHSDQITSIAVDKNTGTVYVGTDKGLTSFKTLAIEPETSFNGLTIFPNPYYLNFASSNVTIEGLIKDTDIKILNITGKLINQFSTPGGRAAFWDGRDQFGELVPTGIYFIVAFDKEGNNVEKGKIAVIRK
jgi:ligand-binding sensor domain-containing protein